MNSQEQDMPSPVEPPAGAREAETAYFDPDFVPSCSQCGRQDETLRIVVYPVIFSFIVLTFRRSFSGMWCGRHRNFWLVLASLITATVGWIGIPFGFIFTPFALLKLARGGDQPAELNVGMLKRLAELKVERGDPLGAIRCLEAALRFGDDASVQARLRELSMRYRSPATEAQRSPLLPVIVLLVGSGILGMLAGLVDFGSGFVWEALFQGQTSIYLVILSWATVVALIFIGGLIFFQLLEWALAHIQCRQTAFAIGLGSVSAALVFYFLLTGETVGRYIQFMLSGMAFESPNDTLITVAAVLTRGGLLTIPEIIQGGGTVATLYPLILAVGAVYLVAFAISKGRAVVQWQERIALSKSSAVVPINLSAGWIALGGVVLGLIFFALLIPQQSVVDYLEAVSHNWQAIAWFKKDRPDRAVSELVAATQLKPEWAAAHANLGWAYANSDQLPQAIAAFKRAVELDPGALSAYRGLGQIYAQQGDYASAKQIYTVAISHAPQDGALYTGLGMAHLLAREYAPATTAFETALKLNPRDGDAHTGLGLVLMSQYRTKEAEDHLTTAIAWTPDSLLAHLGLGQIYYDRGDLDKAITSYEKALKLDPQFWTAQYQLGYAYMGRGEFDRALAAFEAVSRAKPDWASPHALLAVVYFQLGKPDLVQRELTRAVQLAGDDDESHYVLGHAYRLQFQFGQAESYFLKAIELSPEISNYYLDLAYVYSAERKFDQAFQSTDRALAVRKDYAEAYQARAEIYVDQEKLDLALEEALRALALKPEDGTLHSTLSAIYYFKGQTSEALKEAQEAVRLEPYSANGQTRLAFAYQTQGQTDLAQAAAERAVKLYPQGDTAHYVLGLCYRARGDNKNAVAEFEKFLSVYWDRAYIRNYKTQAETYLAQMR